MPRSLSDTLLGDFLLTYTVFMPTSQLCRALLHQYPSEQELGGLGSATGWGHAQPCRCHLVGSPKSPFSAFGRIPISRGDIPGGSLPLSTFCRCP